MSVPEPKRDTSEIHFLNRAREIEKYTIQKCVNFPKRYTFYVSQPLVALATQIHTDVKIGNSIFPTNGHEAQMRLDYFIKAKAELNSLVAQIEIAKELFSISDESMIYWMSLVDEEIALLKGLIKSERCKYRKMFKDGNSNIILYCIGFIERELRNIKTKIKQQVG